jgi:hypothetical protein
MLASVVPWSATPAWPARLIEPHLPARCPAQMCVLTASRPTSPRCPCPRSLAAATPVDNHARMLWTRCSPHRWIASVEKPWLLFGCRAWATRIAEAAPRGRKLEPKGEPFIFLGYKLGRLAYRLYLPSTSKVILSDDVVFVESEFPALSLTGGALAAPPAPAVELHIVTPPQDALCPSVPAPPPRQHAVLHRFPSPEEPSHGPPTTPTPLPRKGSAFNEPSLPSPASVSSPQSPDFIDMLSSGLDGPFTAGMALVRVSRPVYD